MKSVNLSLLKTFGPAFLYVLSGEYPNGLKEKQNKTKTTTMQWAVTMREEEKQMLSVKMLLHECLLMSQSVESKKLNMTSSHQVCN